MRKLFQRVDYSLPNFLKTKKRYKNISNCSRESLEENQAIELTKTQVEVTEYSTQA